MTDFSKIEPVTGVGRWRLWAGPAAFVAVLAAVAVSYPSVDGGMWIKGALNRITAHEMMLACMVLAAGGAGAATSILAGHPARRRPAGVLAGLLAAGAVTAVVVRQTDFAAWYGEEDWMRIALLVSSGAAWGLGWAFGKLSTGATPPRWAFSIPFLVAAVAAGFASSSLGVLTAMIWLLLMGPALGLQCWALLGRGRHSELPRPGVAVAFSLGTTLLGALAFVLGLCHLAYLSVFLIVLSLVSLASRRAAAELVRRTARWLRQPERLSVAACTSLGIFAGVIFCQWVAVVAPEVGSDATGGRAALPIIWLRHGAISARPEIIGSYMGIGGESLFLLFAPFAGACMAKSVALACLLIASLAIVRCRAGTVSEWAIGAATAFAASTMVWMQTFWGFCDLLQALLIFAALDSIGNWRRSDDIRHVLIASLIAGWATAIKLNAVWAIAAVASIAIFAEVLRHRGIRRVIGVGWAAVIPASLVLAPTMLRSLLLTGNPVFPFANAIFKSPLAPQRLVEKHFGLPLGLGALQAVYQVFLKSEIYVEIGTYHPLLLPLMAASVAAMIASRRTNCYWLAIVLVSGVFWLATEQNLRYAIFVALFAAAYVSSTDAVLIAGCRRSMSVTASWLMVAALLVGIVVQFARPAFFLAGENERAGLPLDFAFGGESKDAYLLRNQETYRLAQALNQSAGRSARVWLTPWIRDHLYFEGTAISSPHGDMRMLAPLEALLPGPRPSPSPKEIARALRAAGLTHVILNVENPWNGNTPESEWSAIFAPEFTDHWLEPMAADETLRLYRIPDHPPSSRAVSLGRFPLSHENASFRVSPNQLYEIRLTSESKAPTGEIDFAWYGENRRLLMFEPWLFPHATAASWHRWLQTSPAGAANLEIGVHSSGWNDRDFVEVMLVIPSQDQ